MTVTASIQHDAATTDTITLAGLASSSTLVAGREGTAVDHSVGKEIDSLVGGKVTLHATVAVTANTQIEVWAIGSYDGTSFSGGATGVNANLTPQEKTLLRLVTIIPVVLTTAAQTFFWGPYSLAAVFGGTLPKKTSIFIVHNTGQALNATGSTHEVKRTPVHYVSV